MYMEALPMFQDGVSVDYIQIYWFIYVYIYSWVKVLQ